MDKHYVEEEKSFFHLLDNVLHNKNDWYQLLKRYITNREKDCLTLYPMAIFPTHNPY